MEIKTDMGAYTEGPAPKPGPAGWTFVDPLSGAQVLRLTDERDGPACGNFYSYWPTANRDCTRLLAAVGNGAGLVIDFDPAGFKRGEATRSPPSPARTLTSGATTSTTNSTGVACQTRSRSDPS